AKKLEMEKPAALADFSQPQLLHRTAELIDIMRAKTSTELAALMGISTTLSELNERRFKAWHKPFDLNNAKQSLFAFRGDVYASLDADSLDADGVAYAQRHLRILSGLYGLLRPLDLMQAYRLEMGTRLAGGHGRDLYAFWGNTLNEALAKELATHQDKTLVNLASGEYSKAIDPSFFHGRVVNVHFKEEKAGVLRTIGIHAKRARGMMCRYAIDNRVQSPEALKGFNLASYTYHPELSTDSEWVFAR
ncbi:MAG: peroxide stress protein YaaA, partial [Mariprofundaceae bacterium]|nr:peroxide stress protein YaaA [Mariprofundaceae bacterium]